METSHNLTNVCMVMLLTMAVSIEKIPEQYRRKFGTCEMLMRNNYRVLAMNEIIVETSHKLGMATVDLFSWSLSAGCDHCLDALHMARHVYSGFGRTVANKWFPAILGG